MPITALCSTQSAMFSGLNLAFFSLTRLRLEIEAEMMGKGGAEKVLAMRKDSNFLLTTILWDIPLVIKDETSKLGVLIKDLKGDADINSDTPIEKDVVLFWGKNKKRIIAGPDIFGRLLKGI